MTMVNLEPSTRKKAVSALTAPPSPSSGGGDAGQQAAQRFYAPTGSAPTNARGVDTSSIAFAQSQDKKAAPVAPKLLGPESGIGWKTRLAMYQQEMQAFRDTNNNSSAMDRDQMKDAGDTNRTGMTNDAALQREGMSQSGATKRQGMGDTAAMNRENVQQSGAMDREKLTQTGLDSRLGATLQGAKESDNRKLVTERLIHGAPATAADSNIYNSGGNFNPDVSQLTKVPTKADANTYRMQNLPGKDANTPDTVVQYNTSDPNDIRVINPVTIGGGNPLLAPPAGQPGQPQEPIQPGRSSQPTKAPVDLVKLQKDLDYSKAAIGTIYKSDAEIKGYLLNLRRDNPEVYKAIVGQ